MAPRVGVAAECATSATLFHASCVTAVHQLRVLSDAADGAQMYELLQEVRSHFKSGEVVFEKALTLAEALPALRHALLAGDVFLSDERGAIDLTDALRLTEDDRYWDPARWPRTLLLDTTSKGDDTYRRLIG
jgi:hypothetical protein